MTVLKSGLIEHLVIAKRKRLRSTHVFGSRTLSGRPVPRSWRLAPIWDKRWRIKYSITCRVTCATWSCSTNARCVVGDQALNHKREWPMQQEQTASHTAIACHWPSVHGDIARRHVVDEFQLSRPVLNKHTRPHKATKVRVSRGRHPSCNSKRSAVSQQLG